MSFHKFRMISVVCFCFFLDPALAQGPGDINAASWILADTSQGQILAAANAELRRPPASLTKVMTAYVVLSQIQKDHLSLDDMAVVPLQVEHLRPEEAKMFLKKDQRVSIGDLLRGLIVTSANDAAITLAEHFGGSQDGFVKLMNQAAQKLEMKQSHFVNPTGISALNHYSTASDLMKLAIRISKDHPEYFGYSSQKELVFQSFRKRNTNDLIGSKLPVDGMKTGYIKTAGWCVMLSALKGSSKIDPSKPERLIAVILGAPTNEDRFKAGRQLLKFGFSHPLTQYPTPKVRVF